MKNEEYLNEDRYQRNKKKIANISVLVLIIGFLIGGSLIYIGVKKSKENDSKYSSNNKESIEEKLNKEKEQLEKKKSELESYGITWSVFTTYDDGKSYDLKIITQVLDPSFDHCTFDEYKNNSLTLNYCSLKNKRNSINSEFNKKFDSYDSLPFYMFGTFVIIATCMISLSIYMITKRREIMAFTTQQVMPVAQEGIEKMAPTIGTVAKEITKGIKQGLNDDENK